MKKKKKSNNKKPFRKVLDITPKMKGCYRDCHYQICYHDKVAPPTGTPLTFARWIIIPALKLMMTVRADFAKHNKEYIPLMPIFIDEEIEEAQVKALIDYWWQLYETEGWKYPLPERE